MEKVWYLRGIVVFEGDWLKRLQSILLGVLSDDGAELSNGESRKSTKGGEDICPKYRKSITKHINSINHFLRLREPSIGKT